MQRESLLRRADRLRRAADEVIRQADVVRLFSSLGDVSFIGSYRLDVMYRPDIDLIVTSDNPDRKEAIGLTTRLLESGYFQTVGFADWFNYRREGTPRGFYWELIVPSGGADWKLDAWYLSWQEDLSIRRTERYAKLLEDGPSAREVILKLKSELFNGTRYEGGIGGLEICAAVLERGIRSAAQLRRHTP